MEQAVHLQQLKQFLILFAREHSNEVLEGHVTSAAALRVQANLNGCTELDVVEALKALHEEGILCLQKWDWFLHSFQPWQEWQGESFFNSFQMVTNRCEVDGS
jgi:hypothetical protein